MMTKPVHWCQTGIIDFGEKQELVATGNDGREPGFPQAKQMDA